MLTQLIDHSEDLKRLKAEGYHISIINGNNLLVQEIPYVNKERKIKFGSIFCSLTISGEQTAPPSDHTVYFVGEHPCSQDGREETSYVNSPNQFRLTGDIVSSYYFSSKPDCGKYLNFYDKMKRYIDLLSAPAKSLDPHISTEKFDYRDYNENSVFKYSDTCTSRAGIGNVSKKLENQKIAIIGLGGTGSFVLDFVTKTPVKEISIFDGDEMFNHNAFRIPGAMSLDELKERPSKVSYLKEKYEKLRDGIIAHNLFLDSSNLHLLTGHDFVFISIDNGAAKKIIITFLISSKIPFVDLGMGISLVEDSLRGTIRKTLITPENQSFLEKIDMETTEHEDLYSSNIQISELNALNAILGVISWKKLYGFYAKDQTNYNSTFIIDEKEIYNEA